MSFGQILKADAFPTGDSDIARFVHVVDACLQKRFNNYTNEGDFPTVVSNSSKWSNARDKSRITAIW